MAIENNVISISKNKFQPWDASSMTIIQFNITKLNNHDYTIFQNHGHPFMIVVMKMA
jgi:hypothetical protein